MNLRFLEAFVWIARLGSFRRAAARLNISQAAISSRIATLEEQMGHRLFDRDSRDLRLTQAGQTLLIFSERMLETQRELKRAIAQTDAPHGTVRIGVIESVVHTVLPGILQALQVAYPSLALEITSEPSRALQDLLKRGAIDIAMHTSAVTDANIRNDMLCEFPMGWIRRHDPDTARHPSDFSALSGYPIITFPHGSLPHASVLDAFRESGTQLNLLHCIASIAVIMRLVHAGIGIASMPLAAIEQELDSSQVALIADDVRLPHLPIMISYRPEPGNEILDAVVETARRETRAYCIRVGERFAIPLDR
ncbi:LysR family transcriptional regulator [Gluconacetobacter azotocaptans]|uniref:LysR family transcriptional regulator n=1 Tax=Gluconacetobacter azotocaptans TaxID=142834 RepID=UPI00195DD088|nr:LysR family transcriptional regulator [Gluconacetobacter azotocaptans]MBM9400668.1 LysR family transcriptional regulator [Gluconacetobacter azotocaptans]